MTLAHWGELFLYCSFFSSFSLILKPKRLLLTLTSFFLTVSFLILTSAHVFDQFNFLNVFLNSSVQKPLLYKIAGVWGNHEGSMLLFVTLLSWVFLLKKTPKLHVFQAASLGIFILYCLVWCPAFEALAVSSTQGMDMNPLLQDPLLAIHPPLLYLGYALATQAFLKTLYKLLTGNQQSPLRKDVLHTWLFLSIGLVLGSIWAYYELGWGGYWFWDPVENAALMPWIGFTIVFHLLCLKKETQRNLQMVTTLSIFISYGLCLFGILLVRSGLITSVHSFAFDPQRGMGLLFIFFIAILVMGISVFIKKDVFAPLSTAGLSLRDKLLTLGMSGLFLILSTVFLGTIYPLILSFFSLSLTVGENFYNLVIIPLTLPLFILMTFSSLLKGETFQKNNCISSLLLSVFIGFFLFISNKELPLMQLVILSILSFCALSLILQTIKERKMTPMTQAHLGVIVTGLGMALSSSFSAGDLFLIQEGQIIERGDKTIKLESVLSKEFTNFTAQEALLKVEGVLLTPQKRFYHLQKSIHQETDLKTTCVLSQYYALLGQEYEGKNWSIQLFHKKYIHLIWIGAVILLLAVLRRVVLLQRN